jgi:hypothetical protein
LGLGLVQNYNDHYVLPAIVFLFCYLIYRRKGKAEIFSFISLLIILISSFIVLPRTLNKITWATDIRSTNYMVNVIADTITENNLQNNNIAVLASDDPNTYGRRYRDLLHLREISLMSKGEYQYSDHLFVVSTNSENDIRNDPAYEINNFREGTLTDTWYIPDSKWKIYLFNRS